MSSSGAYRPSSRATTGPSSASTPGNMGRFEKTTDWMPDWIDLVGQLTPSELRVLAVLCGNPGCTNSQLAELLSVTESCVEFHLRNIYRKTGAHGKVCLLLVCKDLGFDRVATKFIPCRLAAD